LLNKYFKGIDKEEIINENKYENEIFKNKKDDMS